MDAEKLKAVSEFFDSLVDLVPPQYYLDDGREPVRQWGLAEWVFACSKCVAADAAPSPPTSLS